MLIGFSLTFIRSFYSQWSLFIADQDCYMILNSDQTRHKTFLLIKSSPVQIYIQLWWIRSERGRLRIVVAVCNCYIIYRRVYYAININNGLNCVFQSFDTECTETYWNVCLCMFNVNYSHSPVICEGWHVDRMWKAVAASF
jgi:hypothetical protein